LCHFTLHPYVAFGDKKAIQALNLHQNGHNLRGFGAVVGFLATTFRGSGDGDEFGEIDGDGVARLAQPSHVWRGRLLALLLALPKLL
jgi:hypothetical protein